MRCLFICIALLLSLSGVVFGFAGGDGSAADPWQIETKADLEAVNDDLTAHYILNNDIWLTNNVYTHSVIATNEVVGVYDRFTGSFNGNGFAVKNLTISGGENKFIGLFGIVDDGAEIYDLGVEDCYITGRKNVGALAGDVSLVRIDNCYSTGNVIGNESNVGGLVGFFTGCVTNSYSTAYATGADDFVGGLIGYSIGTIGNCYATGVVTGMYDHVGGLAGYSSGLICNSYSVGVVTGGGIYIGGLVGAQNYGGILNCYATGRVHGENDYVGGLVGHNRGYSSITNCYATGLVTCSEGSLFGSLVGSNEPRSLAFNCYFLDGDGPGDSVALPLSDIAMREQGSFTGWDFIGEDIYSFGQIWQMPQDGGYPELTVFDDNYTPVVLAGDGTVASPYQIGSAAELGAIVYYDNNCYYELTADIDLEGIQLSSAVIPVFAGTFDGSGYVVNNMALDGGNFMGLFGNVFNGEMSNVAIDNYTINGKYNLGALAGNMVYNSTVDFCHSTGNIQGGLYLGGLVGTSTNGGIITNSYSIGDISGGQYVGGLVGHSFREGKVHRCYSEGSVYGSQYVGGLVGNSRFNSIVSNSYSHSDVEAYNYCGGLVGWNYSSIISNCYSTGSVMFVTNYGGALVGRDSSNANARITSCYFLDTAGFDNGYGSPLSDSEMKQQSSFSDWDFYGLGYDGVEDIWRMPYLPEYPLLSFQRDIPGDVAGCYGVDTADFAEMANSWLMEYDWCDMLDLAGYWLAGK